MEDNSWLIQSPPVPLPAQQPPLSPADVLTSVWRSSGNIVGAASSAVIFSLPVNVRKVLQCLGGFQCGSRNYAGNVNFCSARIGPEEPTTLFKEMEVRGPSATLFASLFLSVCVLSAQSLFPSLNKNANHFLCVRIVYIHTCWEKEKKKTSSNTLMGRCG